MRLKKNIQGIRRIHTVPVKCTGFMVSHFVSQAERFLTRDKSRKRLIPFIRAFINPEPRDTVTASEIYKLLGWAYTINNKNLLCVDKNSDAKLRGYISELRAACWEMTKEQDWVDFGWFNRFLLAPSKIRTDIRLEKIYKVDGIDAYECVIEPYKKRLHYLHSQSNSRLLSLKEQQEYGQLALLTMQYTPDDLLIENFRIINLLHESVTTETYLVQSVVDESLSILKLLKKNKAHYNRDREIFSRTAELIASATNPYVPKLTHPISSWADTLYFCVEYLPGKPLHDILCSNSNNILYNSRLELLINIAQIILQLHQDNICHGDLST